MCSGRTSQTRHSTPLLSVNSRTAMTPRMLGVIHLPYRSATGRSIQGTCQRHPRLVAHMRIEEAVAPRLRPAVTSAACQAYLLQASNDANIDAHHHGVE